MSEFRQRLGIELIIVVLLFFLSTLCVSVLAHSSLLLSKPAPSVGIATSEFQSADAILNVNTADRLLAVSADLYGAFFEELSHAGVGGLYSQQIQNSNFEQTHPYDYAPWDPLPFNSSSLSYFLSLNQDEPLSWQSPTSLLIRTTVLDGQSTETVGIQSPGFWGINTVGVKSFIASVWAYSDSIQSLTFSIVDSKYSQVYGTATVSGVKSSWTQLSTVIPIISSANDSAAIFILTWQTTSTVDSLTVDMVSVFPSGGWRGLPFIRADLGDAIAAMSPSVLRFPGGSYVDGDHLMNRYNWKKTIGSLEERTGHQNVWGYFSEDGLGIYEYFSFVEKLTDGNGIPTRAIWVVNVGIGNISPMGGERIPFNHIGTYVRDVMDSLEFILGSSSTKYGKIRSQMGHPAPFNLSYLALGNENCDFGGLPYYQANFPVFESAVHAVYPNLKIIANCNLTSPFNYYDYHTYPSAGFWYNNSNIFDSFNRNQGIFVSEYAAKEGNLMAAISEALFMNNMEKNSDIIHLASYAPLLQNYYAPNWTPNAIIFNTNKWIGSPSYWNQVLYSNSFNGTISNTRFTLNSTLIATNISISVTVGTLTNEEKKKRDNSSNLYIIKAVNYSPYNQNLTVCFQNVPSNATLPSSSSFHQQLTSLDGDLQAINTFQDLYRVSIRLVGILVFSKACFTRELALNSINVFSVYST